MSTRQVKSVEDQQVVLQARRQELLRAGETAAK